MALVPELSLIDPEAGTAWLERVFGFAVQGADLSLGSQRLRVVRAKGTMPHGRIDHIALAVPDIDVALAGLLDRGATLERAVTPDGVGEIAEFWEAGIRYVYLTGPEGARIELCEKIGHPVAAVGHDHIGIPCRDVTAMQRFFEAEGAQMVAAVDLPRPGGMVPVRFLEFAGGMIELYAPQGADRPAEGHWSRLLVGGLAAERIGPDGLTLAPL